MYEIYETKERIIADNDAVAALVRERMDGAGVFFVNVMASPGAGKTTLLKRTIESLPEYKIGVMEADVDSDVDAFRHGRPGHRLSGKRRQPGLPGGV